MSCGCGTRAEKFLRKLGYQDTETNDGPALETSDGSVRILKADLKQHHFRLTLYGVWKYLTLG